VIGHERLDGCGCGDRSPSADSARLASACGLSLANTQARLSPRRKREESPENKAVFPTNANFTAKLTVIGGCKLHKVILHILCLDFTKSARKDRWSFARGAEELDATRLGSDK